MTEVLIFAAGLLVGGLVIWFLATSRARAAAAGERSELQARLGAGESTIGELRRRVAEQDQETDRLRTNLQSEQQARVMAETRLDESVKNIAEQRKLLEAAEKRLKDAFAALSVDSLRQNSEAFAKQAAEKVRPLVEALQRYESEIKQIEESRQKAYGGINEQLKAIASTHKDLSRETASLVTALRAPQTKGRWGEITLQRAVEVAGLSAHCDFITQVSVDTDEGRLRPDLVVMLPGNRAVVVDAKAPTSAYLDAVESSDEEARRRHLARHAQAVRTHMHALAGKAYWSQFATAPEFVVMFVPGEAFFSAALEQDRDLIEEGIRKRVIIASPTTLIALLRAVAYSWQQQELIENAREIGQTAQQLFERVCTFAGHLDKVGDSLRRATETYNASVASWESRVLPMGRRVNELGVTAKQADFAKLERIEASPRSLPIGEAAEERKS
jgi:DNA recombination protein RmuC